MEQQLLNYQAQVMQHKRYFFVLFHKHMLLINTFGISIFVVSWKLFRTPMARRILKRAKRVFLFSVMLLTKKNQLVPYFL